MNLGDVMDMEKAKILFKQFVLTYDVKDERIRRKYEHSLNVVDLCEKIAIYLNLPKEDILIAKMIGLLHDFGRFEQIKVYNTFDDKRSVDHAKLGIKLLEEFGFAEFVTDKSIQNLIKKAILNHNKNFIDDNLSEREKLFAKIIRDADKIDIYRLWQENEFETVSSLIDDKIYERMLKCEYDYESITNKLDYYVLLLGLIYDVNFAWSIKYLKEKDYLNIILDKVIKANLHEEKRLNNIKEKINSYIERRMDDVGSEI